MEQSKERILNAIIDNHPFQGLGDEEYKMALQAMEEYANAKLHLLQQEYDKLRDVHYDLRNQHESLDKAAIRQNELIINLQEQYDKLKAGCLEDYTNLSKQYMALFAEHAALKEKADRMARMLNVARDWMDVYTDDNDGSHMMQRAADISGQITDCLSSYNSNTNQNENNG